MTTFMELTDHNGIVTQFFDTSLDAAQRWLAQHPIGTFATAVLVERDDDEIITILEV